MALHSPGNLAGMDIATKRCRRRSRRRARFHSLLIPAHQSLSSSPRFPPTNHSQLIPRYPRQTGGSAESLFQPRKPPFPMYIRYAGRQPRRSFVSSPSRLLYTLMAPHVTRDVVGYLHRHGPNHTRMGGWHFFVCYRLASYRQSHGKLQTYMLRGRHCCAAGSEPARLAGMPTLQYKMYVSIETFARGAMGL